MNHVTPFPLSESSVEQLAGYFEAKSRALRTNLGLPDYRGYETEPLFLLRLEEWRDLAKDKFRVLGWTVDDLFNTVVSPDDESYRLYVTLEAIRTVIETEMEKAQDLIQWAKTCWRDDPVIKRIQAEQEPSPTQ